MGNKRDNRREWTMSYDTKCYDLASAFLDDEQDVTEQDRDRLAQHIQTGIEDWLRFYRKSPMIITVNGDRCELPRGRISYSEIARLAGKPDDEYLSITYHGRRHIDRQRSGILSYGQSIDGDDGLIFNAMRTGNA